MGKDCWTCGHAGTGGDVGRCEVYTTLRGHSTIASWVDDWTEDDGCTAKKGAPDCPGWTEDDRVTATPEPPPADPRLLAMANGELAARVRELEAAVAQKARIIVKMRAALDWSREDGRQEERAAVVAWLRGAGNIGETGAFCGAVAEAIERGEHRREGEK
jgi:hypothetical protein